jgi:heme/copper-type cytochrome/quinol oxidase subunit 4
VAELGPVIAFAVVVALALFQASAVILGLLDPQLMTGLVLAASFVQASLVYVFLMHARYASKGVLLLTITALLLLIPLFLALLYSVEFPIHVPRPR